MREIVGCFKTNRVKSDDVKSATEKINLFLDFWKGKSGFPKWPGRDCCKDYLINCCIYY